MFTQKKKQQISAAFSLSFFIHIMLLSITKRVLIHSPGRMTRPMSTYIPKIFDLTSDTATEPTDDHFDMMKTASRKDDVFGVKK